jgi:hypothetical protein
MESFNLYSKKEKTIKKASAAKIASLAGFIQVDAPLFFHLTKL